jgi:hypothetical protein
MMICDGLYLKRRNTKSVYEQVLNQEVQAEMPKEKPKT